MDNQDQIKLLKSGVNNWNQWRAENPGIQPDLYKADLKGMDLREADLITKKGHPLNSIKILFLLEWHP